MTKEFDMDEVNEEANFVFTLQTLDELVNMYGVEKVITNLSDKTYEAFFNYFMPPDDVDVDNG